MRIAFVSDVVYPYVRGGAEKRIHEFSARLRDSGHEVHVYGIQWWGGAPLLVQDGIAYHGVCRPRGLYSGGRRSIGEALAFGLALALPLLRERFDVIDCNQHPYFSVFPCRLATLLRGGRLYVTWHEAWGDYWYEYLGWGGFFGAMVEWMAARLGGRAIAVSRSTAAGLGRLGVRGERITVVPNGISAAAIAAVPPATAAADVVFAGRLVRDKRVDALIRACAMASRKMPLRLLVVGDGPERAALESLASGFGLDARFTGAVDDAGLVSALKSARVFVLPSAREGFSIVTLEALACGVPVIAVDSDRNAARELVDDGVTGRLSGASDGELAAAILDVLGDEAGRSRMAANCAPAAREYDWDLLCSRLVECYRK